MARSNYNLLELDVDKLFEEHKIEEIIEIEKLLDAEIERKRVEMRSMVGDRYKDVLAASDAIKNMKAISQKIVDNIQTITDVCESLIENEAEDHEMETPITETRKNDEERALIIQVRLAIFMNEQIWICLDRADNLAAAEFYLLAQHIHMGLNLVKGEYLEKLPLLKHIKDNLAILKDQIFIRIRHKLQSVEITAQETSSNLNALLLLKNQSTSELLNILIEHRTTTLNTVMNTPHDSVRLQISAMVKCLITTINLLHDCFMCYGESKNGLIWQQLQTIVEDSSTPTLSKVQMPETPLISYLPETVTQFRPKYNSGIGDFSRDKVNLDEWLESVKVSIQSGLRNFLNLITNVKGLHLIREESLKIELPKNWDRVCVESNLPENFNVWYYFFQNIITARARELISKKIVSVVKCLEEDIRITLNSELKAERNEGDLRWYTWIEEPTDISRTGLSMKTLGYSENVVNFCKKLDSKFLELLVDVAQYLYGKEYEDEAILVTQVKSKKRFIDREELENHLRIESTQHSKSLAVFLQNCFKSSTSYVVAKSLLCARLLQAVTSLCPHFKICCTFNGSTDDWLQICNHFTKVSLQFWEGWVMNCVQETEKACKGHFSEVDACSMISVLLRWDTIEIQEQTDEKVFKSQIKVPLKPSLILHQFLNKLNNDLSQVLPHTLPKQIHVQFIEKNVEIILNHYGILSSRELNQNQSLQFLFDVKFLTTFCIPRENARLIALSQEICDKLRLKIDPFDLDVFYAYLQNNVKRAVLQCQVILGCLLPSSAQLANLGISEKFKDQEKDPSILALSVPSVPFPSFSTFAHQLPSHKVATVDRTPQEVAKVSSPRLLKTSPKKPQDPTAALRSSAAALFGGLTTDWFS